MMREMSVLWSIWRKPFEARSITKLLPRRPSLLANLPTMVVSLPLIRDFASFLPSLKSAAVAFYNCSRHSFSSTFVLKVAVKLWVRAFASRSATFVRHSFSSFA